MFKGSMVALVTPFKNNKIDEPKLKELVEFQIKGGTQGLVPCGTTGESATLSIEEHEQVIEIVVKAAAGRVPVIAGTGSNCTREATILTKAAKEAGADGALLITPYYNKPTQKGIYLHTKAISDAVQIPIVLYNIASRTGTNIEPETVCRMADIENVVAIKEASGNLEQMKKIKELCGDKLDLISGDDALTLPVMELGGVGVISVVANIVPEKVRAIIDLYNSNKQQEAEKAYQGLMPLVKAMFFETNPIPVKTAMSLMGMVDLELRLPMCELEEENLNKLKAVLEDYQLI